MRLRNRSRLVRKHRGPHACNRQTQELRHEESESRHAVSSSICHFADIRTTLLIMFAPCRHECKQTARSVTCKETTQAPQSTCSFVQSTVRNHLLSPPPCAQSQKGCTTSRLLKQGIAHVLRSLLMASSRLGWHAHLTPLDQGRRSECGGCFFEKEPRSTAAHNHQEKRGWIKRGGASHAKVVLCERGLWSGGGGEAGVAVALSCSSYSFACRI